MRCAIYARVSTDSSDQKDSLENQVSFFENFIQQQGWELTQTYADEGITGTSIVKRIQLKRLMDDAHKKKFDIVLIKSISRWARDTVDSITLVRSLKSLGIRLMSIEDCYDSFQDDDEYKLTNLSVFAQMESQRIATRVSFGITEKSRKGVFHGTPPYGYSKENGKLVPNPLHAPTAKLIFDLYLNQGWGTQKIANYLTSQGVPTPRKVLVAKNAGNRWHQSAINSILTNPHYTGDLMQGRTKTDKKDKAFNQARGYKKRIIIDHENG
jgi:DNA invertase Pin-like site-specific DNA recombinase